MSQAMVQLSEVTGEGRHAYKVVEHEEEDNLEHVHLLHIPAENLLISNNAPKISIRDLHRYTDSGDLILSEISLDISAGTVLGIIGPSGSGKSTLLRAINRLWEPAQACVFLDGKDITTLDVISVRRRVGMLFQLPALFDGSSA
ncbi:hypothetical protein KP509_12G016300 [Ceratopteris richardii]|uniref:ABC transporter domain-containing protein n=1 Tax=Ceratopteris richardii TaxID=49495 RepID=A0A8T2TIZ2_CERRI|nr:hypothetical protein KP509_12G016300 [Ceratopteris richardii]